MAWTMRAAGLVAITVAVAIFCQCAPDESPPPQGKEFEVTPTSVDTTAGSHFTLTASVRQNPNVNPNVKINLVLTLNGAVTGLADAIGLDGLGLTDEPNLTFQFPATAGRGRDRVAFELICGSGDGSVTIKANDRVEQLGEATVPVHCAAPDGGAPESGTDGSVEAGADGGAPWHATLEQVAMDDPGTSSYIVNLPTIAEGIVAYQLSTNTVPSMHIWQTPGADNVLSPEPGYTLKNTTSQVAPFAGNEDRACGKGTSWTYTGVMQDDNTNTSYPRVIKVALDGTATKIAQAGDPAPGFPSTNPMFEAFQDPILDDCMDAVFFAYVNGTKSIWREASGLNLILAEGQSLPGAGAGWVFQGLTLPRYAPDIDRTWVLVPKFQNAAVPDGSSGLFSIDNFGSAHCEALENAPAGSCDRVAQGRINDPSFADGVVVYSEGIGPSQIVRHGASGVEVADVLYKGPGGDGSYLGIQSTSDRPLACPVDASVYFAGVFQPDANSQQTGGVFRWNGGDPTTLGRADKFPGVDETFGPLDQIEIAINDTCGVVARASNGLVDGIWARDADGGWVKLAQTGDVLDTSTGQKTVEFVKMVTGANGFDHRPQAIDGAGRITFLVDFKDSTQAIYYAELHPGT